MPTLTKIRWDKVPNNNRKRLFILVNGALLWELLPTPISMFETTDKVVELLDSKSNLNYRNIEVELFIQTSNHPKEDIYIQGDEHEFKIYSSDRYGNWVLNNPESQVEQPENFGSRILHIIRSVSKILG